VIALADFPVPPSRLRLVESRVKDGYPSGGCKVD
jgi:hypothetical protein